MASVVFSKTNRSRFHKCGFSAFLIQFETSSGIRKQISLSLSLFFRYRSWQKTNKQKKNLVSTPIRKKGKRKTELCGIRTGCQEVRGVWWWDLLHPRQSCLSWGRALDSLSISACNFYRNDASLIAPDENRIEDQKRDRMRTDQLRSQ